MYAGTYASDLNQRKLLDSNASVIISTGSATEMQKPCPTWLADYAAFHNTNRYNPSAKYLIYHCSHSKADEKDHAQPQFCNGLADRLKGIMFMTRIAHATKRILIINQTHPEDLTVGIMPASFDWRVGNLSTPCDDMKFPCHGTDAAGRSINATYWTSWGWYSPLPESFTDGSIVRATETHMYMTAIHPPEQNLPDWVPAFAAEPSQGSNYHCLFSLLFTASERVEQRVTEFEQSMWPAQSEQLTSFDKLPARYVAIHLRMKIDGVHLSDEEVKDAFVCARILAAQYNLSSVFVASDNPSLRAEITRGEHPGCVTVELKPTNFDAMKRHEHHGVEGFVETVAEFVMLGRSSCLIMSRSGFSEMAQMMGGQDCWSTVHHCAQTVGMQ